MGLQQKLLLSFLLIKIVLKCNYLFCSLSDFKAQFDLKGTSCD